MITLEKNNTILIRLTSDNINETKNKNIVVTSLKLMRHNHDGDSTIH